MKTFDGCVLISDFDGTLINSKGVISPENIEAIKDFVDRGGLFCGATGRTQSNLGSHLDGLPIMSPWILYNGAALYDFKKREFLFTETLDHVPLLPLIKSIMEVFPQVNTQIFTAEMLYLVNPDGRPDHILDAERHIHEKIAMDDIKTPWLKMLFQGEKEVLKQIEAVLEKRLDQEHYRYFYSGDAYLEVTDKKVSKGRGLLALREVLGEKAKCVLAIGDYYNDVEMIKWADVGATPANAPEDIKRLADVVTKNHNDHAVADLIHWLEKKLSNLEPVLEVCVDSYEGAKTAVEAGADRLELCVALSVGGLTPEIGLLARVTSSLEIPVQVMIRPREGGFVYTQDEIMTMVESIKWIKQHFSGVRGFVAGVLTPENTINVPAMTLLVETCRPYPLTMHRAFDRLEDLEKGLELCMAMGVERILTSGGGENVEAGIENLKKLSQKASGKIVILPGGGVHQGNAEELMENLEVFELHQSGRKDVKSGPHGDDVYQTVSEIAIKATKNKMLKHMFKQDQECVNIKLR